MPSLNKVFLMGNLTRDPELRYTSNGTAVVAFGLAINRRYKSGDDWKTEVSYFDVEVWGKQAENVNQYLTKGSGALVEGYLKQDRWEDESGGKRAKIKVVANNVQFMSKKSESTKQGPSEDQGPPESYDSGNLPF